MFHGRDIIMEEMVTPVLGTVASGTTEQTTTAVTFGEDGDRVVFDICWGAISGAQTVEIELSQDGTNYTKLLNDAGATLELPVTTASANKMSQIQLNAFNAKKARLVIPRDNAAAIVSVVARQYGGRQNPSRNTNVPDLRYVHAYAPNRLPNGQRVQVNA